MEGRERAFVLSDWFGLGLVRKGQRGGELYHVPAEKQVGECIRRHQRRKEIATELSCISVVMVDEVD